jgi:hypothetical protein
MTDEGLRDAVKTTGNGQRTPTLLQERNQRAHDAIQRSTQTHNRDRHNNTTHEKFEQRSNQLAPGTFWLLSAGATIQLGGLLGRGPCDLWLGGRRRGEGAPRCLHSAKARKAISAV